MIESPPELETRDADLVLDQLTWRPYGRHQPTVRDVSLTLRAGERVLLVGASGSGKSTLLRAMAGLLDDSLGEQSGTVRLGGDDPQDVAGSAGLLLQDPTHSLVAEFVGRDAAFGPENRALSQAQIQIAVSESLAGVGFPYAADRPTFALSGGEMQRLALAGSLALGPSWLLLDEPTAMLDPGSAAQIRAAVADVVETEQLGLVVVEHRLDGWVDVCDRLVVLADDGSVLADGPTDSVLRDRAGELADAGIWVPGVPAPRVPRLEWPGPERQDAGTRLALVGLEVQDPAGRTLVDGLSLSLRSGEAAAVVGPSGSGKSTLLRTVAGLQAPAAGSVAPVAAESGRIGWVPQHAEEVVTRRTVREEALATSRVIFADRPDRLAAAEQRADAVLEALGLAELAGADPYQISGGEQRRLALATAVVHGPTLLLLDEPTVGQDRQTWAAVRAVVEAVRAEGTAVLISTHDRLLAEGLDRVVRLGSRPAPVEGHRPPDFTIRPIRDPRAPLVARCNPLALLIIGVGAAVGSFFVRDWLVGLITLLFGLALSPLAVRTTRPALLRLVPVGIAALTVGWSTLLFSSAGWFAAEAVPVAIREVLRIGCLVVPGALLLGALEPSELGDALAQRLHAPHRVVAAATSALLRLELMRSQWRSLDEVRRLRGLAPGRSPADRVRYLASLTIALLVWMFRSAQQMAVSMDARGFAGATRRTFALDSPWRRRDWFCCLVAVVVLVLPIMLGRLL